jgi:hypothetical protein
MGLHLILHPPSAGRLALELALGLELELDFAFISPWLPYATVQSALPLWWHLPV